MKNTVKHEKFLDSKCSQVSFYCVCVECMLCCMYVCDSVLYVYIVCDVCIVCVICVCYMCACIVCAACVVFVCIVLVCV